MSGGDPQQQQSRAGYDRIHSQQSSSGSPGSGLRHHGASPRGEDMDSDSSPRGQKRRLAPYDARGAYDSRASASHRSSNTQSSVANALAVASALSRHDQQQQLALHGHDDDEDEASSTQFGDAPRGSHGPRDELRYETWTSKQLRKKCSHLKLRGLKNVKKHVMVDALYRYYRTQRQKELLGVPNTTTTTNNNSSSSSAKAQASDARSTQHSNGNDAGRGAAMAGRYDHHRTASSPSSSSAAAYSSNATNATMNRSRAATIGSDRSSHHLNNNNSALGSHSSAASSSSLLARKASNANSSSSGNGNGSGAASAAASARASAPVVRHRATSYNDDDDDDAMDGRSSLDNEIHVTSEDVIRLVDVVLSPVFVDRLAVELSRWQFWVDVREKYIAALKTHPLSNYSQHYDHHDSLHRSMHMSMLSSRNFKWSSMQLWEIWKELTFAYTKTCFEFTAAGMQSETTRFVHLAGGS